MYLKTVQLITANKKRRTEPEGAEVLLFMGLLEVGINIGKLQHFCVIESEQSGFVVLLLCRLTEGPTPGAVG